MDVTSVEIFCIGRSGPSVRGLRWESVSWAKKLEKYFHFALFIEYQETLQTIRHVFFSFFLEFWVNCQLRRFPMSYSRFLPRHAKIWDFCQRVCVYLYKLDVLLVENLHKFSIYRNVESGDFCQTACLHSYKLKNLPCSKVQFKLKCIMCRHAKNGDFCKTVCLYLHKLHILLCPHWA